MQILHFLDPPLEPFSPRVSSKIASAKSDPRLLGLRTGRSDPLFRIETEAPSDKLTSSTPAHSISHSTHLYPYLVSSVVSLFSRFLGHRLPNASARWPNSRPQRRLSGEGSYG